MSGIWVIVVFLIECKDCAARLRNNQHIPSFECKCVAMMSNRPNQKPDIFMALVLFVLVGVSATIAYQVSIYYDQFQLTLARQAPSQPPATGG